MCQAQPGPRCYPDTRNKLDRAQIKINGLKDDLKSLRSQQSRAAKKNDLAGFGRLKKKIETTSKKVKALEDEYRWDERDLYGTKTGAAQLQELMRNAKSDAEYERLRLLGVQAEGQRFMREHALSVKKSGYVPAIRLAQKAA